MNRKGSVYYKESFAGTIEETENGYIFTYDDSYRESKEAMPVSLTLPLKEKKYESDMLFPFFDDLIPEGWLLDIAEVNWKIDRRDRMALLLACCEDCIGAVKVVSEK